MQVPLLAWLFGKLHMSARSKKGKKVLSDAIARGDSMAC